jgi:histidyl-tRNA synthetase
VDSGPEPKRITPRTLKGFRDYLPEAMIPRERLIDTARRVYRSYGFSPIDTPALEYLEILAGKGSDETDKQLYKFQDHGGRWVGLRFDLTVPLARFAAQHANELGLPLKRYHIATVWRGENTQRGRYREFMQCDFDTIGTRSVAADIETILVVDELMRAIGFTRSKSEEKPRFQIQLNNRMLLTGLMEVLGLSGQTTAVLRVLDKANKIDKSILHNQLVSIDGVGRNQAEKIVEFSFLAMGMDDNDTTLRLAETFVAGSEIGMKGIARLRDVLAGIEAAGVPATGQGDSSVVRLNLSIARGLDYYTGLVFETELAVGRDPVGIGSVCSGGRYDNLAELFTAQELPGIGASLGLDRLLAAMEELGMVEKVATPAPVFIPFFDPDRLGQYLCLASALRAAGIGTEVFPDPKKLGQQLKYADRRGFRIALIAGGNEFQAGVCQVKDLQTGAKQDVPLEANAASLIAAVQRILGQTS